MELVCRSRVVDEMVSVSHCQAMIEVVRSKSTNKAAFFHIDF